MSYQIDVFLVIERDDRRTAMVQDDFTARKGSVKKLDLLDLDRKDFTFKGDLPVDRFLAKLLIKSSDIPFRLIHSFLLPVFLIGLLRVCRSGCYTHYRHGP